MYVLVCMCVFTLDSRGTATPVQSAFCLQPAHNRLPEPSRVCVPIVHDDSYLRSYLSAKLERSFRKGDRYASVLKLIDTLR